MRRIAAVISLTIGVGLIVFTFADHVVSRARDAEKISAHYRPLMSTAGLNGLRSGFDQLTVAGGELATKALPELQRDLGLNDTQFADYVTQHLPNIKTFDDKAAGIVALVDPVIHTMEAERGDYSKADSIPVGFLPLSSAPWLFLGIAALLVAAGAFALIRPTRMATLALLLIGLGMVIAPLAVGIPGKVDAAMRVTRVGRVGLAPSTAQAAIDATALFDAMVDDVRTKLEPAFAAAAAADAAGNSSTFAERFPTLSAFAESWVSSTSAQSHALSDSQRDLGPTFANADKIPIRPIPWMFMIPGLVLAASAAWTLRRSTVGANAALGVGPYSATTGASRDANPGVR